MKVFQALAQGLRDHGVTTMFGLMGDGNLFFADSFAAGPGRYVASAHEAGAVLMANGYASVSGQLGVATVTHGPGLANALPAVIDSVRSGMPLLLITGDTNPEDLKNLQHIEQRELVLPTGAGFQQVHAPSTAVRDLAAAVRRAMVERRPVVLNVPAQFMWQDVDYAPVTTAPAHAQAVAPDPAALDIAVGALAHAERPIVLAGRGASHPAAREAVLRLAERLGAPVATTLRGLDLFRGEPLALGIFGTLATPVGLDAIGQSDCVLAFGASLNPWTTDSGALLRGKRVIQCDLERSAIGRHQPVHAALVGDAATVADAITDWLDEADVKPSSFGSDGLAQAIRGYSRADEVGHQGAPAAAGTVDFRTAVLHIEDVVPSDRVVVADAGRFMFESYRILHAPDPFSFVHTCNFGSIGLGLANAIGAGVAAPGRPVLLVCGDGGFMLGGITEFTSAVQNRIDLIVVVLNDGAYGAEHIQFRNRDLDPGMTTFDWPDLAPLADALGGQGMTVRTTADLHAIAGVIERRKRPLLLDIKVDPDAVPYEGR